MSPVQESTLVDLTPSDIHAHPDNPRQDATADDELVASVASIGILEPLVVRWVNIPVDPEDPEGEHIAFYELIAGHRRLDAATKVGLLTVPCFVKDFDDDQALEAMLVENLARRDLDPIEEANGLQRLAELGHKPKALAAKLGRSADHIKGRLALLNLPDDYQDALRDGALSLATAAIAAQLGSEVLSGLSKRVRFDHWHLERKLQDQRDAAALAKVTKKYDKAGVSYVERAAPGVKHLGTGYNRLAVDETLHGFEPCHTLVLEVYKGEVIERPACTDPERHIGKGKGKSKLKADVPLDPNEAWEAERAARQAERLAAMTEEERAEEEARIAQREAEAEARAAEKAAIDALVEARTNARDHVLAHKIKEDAALDFLWAMLHEDSTDISTVARLVGVEETEFASWRTKSRANRISALVAEMSAEHGYWYLRAPHRLPIDTLAEAHGIAVPAVVAENDAVDAANRVRFTELATKAGYPQDVIDNVVANADADQLTDNLIELEELLADAATEDDESVDEAAAEAVEADENAA